MEQACRRFEQYLKRRFGQSSTPKHYMSDLNIFMRTIGNKAPEAVTAAEIDAFVDRQLATGLSPSTINRRLSCVCTFFEYLASECPERVWPNPVVGRRHRLRTGSRLPRDASEDDVAGLFTVIADERDRAMFGLMVGAGLRVGEVATLRLDSLEAPVEPGQLARLRVRGKGNKERITWLTSSLWDTLQAWLKVRPPADTRLRDVFLNRSGQPISVSGIQYCLQQHCQAAGVRLTCHQLRHTFSRRLVEHGLPVDSLAKLLGHSHLQTTQRYIDSADPTLRADFDAAMAHLEDAFTQASSHRPPPPKPRPSPQPRMATQDELRKFRPKLDSLQPWLRAGLDAYLGWRWPT